MKINQSTPTTQAKRDAEDFLWHFRAPSATPYSHVHWWLEEDERKLESAVWELMRRHPDAKKAHDQVQADTLPKPLFAFVACHCFKAWSELGGRQKVAFVKRLWKEYPSQLGFIDPPVTMLNDHRRFQDYHRRLNEHGQKTLLRESVDRLALHVQSSALESHNAGQILIAIDPTAPPARIAEGVKSAVADWLKEKPVEIGKSRIDQWLKVIAEFEKEEIDRPKNEIRSNQLFYKYRKVIKNWPLPPDRIVRD